MMTTTAHSKSNVDGLTQRERLIVMGATICLINGLFYLFFFRAVCNGMVGVANLSGNNDNGVCFDTTNGGGGDKSTFITNDGACFASRRGDWAMPSDNSAVLPVCRIFAAFGLTETRFINDLSVEQSLSSSSSSSSSSQPLTMGTKRRQQPKKETAPQKQTTMTSKPSVGSHGPDSTGSSSATTTTSTAAASRPQTDGNTDKSSFVTPETVPENTDTRQNESAAPVMSHVSDANGNVKKRRNLLQRIFRRKQKQSD